MAKYIEQEALIKTINDNANFYGGFGENTITSSELLRCIELTPAADVRPVVRGKWEQKEVFAVNGNVDMLQSAYCPICKKYHTTPYAYYFTEDPFCPNCGADMREREG